MRKFAGLGLLLISLSEAKAQLPLVPSADAFEARWIRNENYEMNWFMVRDTARFQMGSVSTGIQVKGQDLVMITRVNLKNMKVPWTDSTIARLKDLKPVYHSSYNAQRDMALHFGTVVSGYYKDHLKKEYLQYTDTPRASYFDSNLYPYLLSLLPLQDGYARDISIYDYNPYGKKGLLRAFVKTTESGTYQSEKAGSRNVWIVTVTDEIGNGGGGSSTYYFDKEDRRLWKQEISTGNRVILMLRKED